MAKIITAFVHEQLARLQKEEISFSRFVELLNEKANEAEESTKEQAKINVKAMLRQCNFFRDGEWIKVKDAELVEWFKGGHHRKDFNLYDTI